MIRVTALASEISSKASSPVAPISLNTAMASRHLPGVQCRAKPSRKRINDGLAESGMYSGEAGSNMVFSP